MVRCVIGNFAYNLCLFHQDYNASCRDVAAKEAVQHPLCEDSALQNRRVGLLGDKTFEDLDKVANVPLNELTGFFKSSGWFKLNIKGSW